MELSGRVSGVGPTGRRRRRRPYGSVPGDGSRHRQQSHRREYEWSASDSAGLAVLHSFGAGVRPERHRLRGAFAEAAGVPGSAGDGDVDADRTAAPAEPRGHRRRGRGQRQPADDIQPHCPAAHRQIEGAQVGVGVNIVGGVLIRYREDKRRSCTCLLVRQSFNPSLFIALFIAVLNYCKTCRFRQQFSGDLRGKE